MNPYFFTITFLLLMSFLTSSETIRFTQNTLEHKCFLNSHVSLAASEELREYSHLEELRGKENETPKKRESKNHQPKAKAKRIAKLNINTARPPNNSRINIYSLLHKEPHENLPEEFSLYEVVARLMRALNKEELYGDEYRILDKWIEKKAATEHFKTPDDLCSLDLEDAKLQEILFKMCKGSPSLLHFMTFDKVDSPQAQTRKINLLFADPLILQAIFPNERIVEKLLARREEIWQEILYQEAHRLEMDKTECKGRKEFGKDLINALDEVLTSEGLDASKYKSQVFDYKLGKPGTIIFVENPLTHEIRRENYIPYAGKT